jgi:hypothetical protein
LKTLPAITPSDAAGFWPAARAGTRTAANSNAAMAARRMPDGRSAVVVVRYFFFFLVVEIFVERVIVIVVVVEILVILVVEIVLLFEILVILVVVDGFEFQFVELADFELGATFFAVHNVSYFEVVLALDVKFTSTVWADSHEVPLSLHIYRNR